jgi:hypothetical protein
MYVGEKTISNKWCWENWISTCKRLKLDPYLSPCIKCNSKWIKDLNIRSEPKTPIKNRENTWRYKYSQWLSEYGSNCSGNKSKNWQIGLHLIKRLLHIKGNSYQYEETAYSVEENPCQLFIWQGINIQNI